MPCCCEGTDVAVITDVSCLEAFFCVRGLEHLLAEKNTLDECSNERPSMPDNSEKVPED